MAKSLCRTAVAHHTEHENNFRFLFLIPYVAGQTCVELVVVLILSENEATELTQ